MKYLTAFAAQLISILICSDDNTIKHYVLNITAFTEIKMGLIEVDSLSNRGL